MSKNVIGYGTGVAQVLALAFGKSSIPLIYKNVSEQQNGATISDYQVVTDQDLDNEDTVESYLGTPIVFPMTFKGGNYKQFNNGAVEDIEMADFRMPATTMVDFKRSKIMKTKKLSGGVGDVKFIYGHTGWMLEIRGVMLPDPSQPQSLKTVVDQKRRLKKWDDIVSAIEVEGALFEHLDIYNLVIKDIIFNSLEGQPKVVPFTITAESDEPVELL